MCLLPARKRCARQPILTLASLARSLARCDACHAVTNYGQSIERELGLNLLRVHLLTFLTVSSLSFLKDKEAIIYLMMLHSFLPFIHLRDSFFVLPWYFCFMFTSLQPCGNKNTLSFMMKDMRKADSFSAQLWLGIKNN